ncbi:ribbon-helix-helix domain-containing protein [Roseibium sp. RKSG952]|uniref:ribbon-helix-helix domain-containing protein n=1 Tax=Roseibium sp. RKSG952 TaxID=2529384 RepID=UPI0012BC8505|nr:ribbon-helix-helix domain-containing protein [Roseibium sp. RKSG952]MTH96740.1 aryl-sulfate sulfotransferase [Roseibium sp. RKSG952]
MPLVKRSITLHGHRTSLALEPEFWAVIDSVSDRENRSLASVIARIDETRTPEDALSSTVRVWVLKRALESAFETEGGPENPL